MNGENATSGQCEKLQEKILAEYPRLGADDTFRFGCHAGVSCFNRCCGDANIFLSPYDVLRMKKRLDMTSSDFLDQYALMPVQKEMQTPVVVLRFAFLWLRFSLFGDPTVRVKADVAQAFKGKLDKKELFGKKPG